MNGFAMLGKTLDEISGNTNDPPKHINFTGGDAGCYTAECAKVNGQGANVNFIPGKDNSGKAGQIVFHDQDGNTMNTNDLLEMWQEWKRWYHGAKYRKPLNPAHSTLFSGNQAPPATQPT